MISRRFKVFGILTLTVAGVAAVCTARSLLVRDSFFIALDRSDSAQIVWREWFLRVEFNRGDCVAIGDYTRIATSTMRPPKGWKAGHNVLALLPAWHGANLWTPTSIMPGARLLAFHGSKASLPMWLAFFPALYWIIAWRIKRRPGVGRCKQCGYDLRATPERCPECGAIP